MNRTPQLASRLTKSSAFTLIEIMIAIVISGLVAASDVPAVQRLK